MAAIDDATTPPKAAPVAANPTPRSGSDQPAQTPSRRRSSVPQVRRRSLFGRLLSTITRLLTWYSIITILFRCPASLDACDDSSPRVCKLYFTTRQTIIPYLNPVYDAYAAPYVDVVRPYYDTVDRSVISPARLYAAQTAGPQLAHLQTLARTQWDASVQPQLAAAQAAAAAQYAEHLAPTVDRATAAVAPYAAQANAAACRAYHEAALPALRFVSPYVARGYTATANFTTGTAVPTAIWTWYRVAAFLDDAVWPRLQVLYVDTVEPQLTKIGQRLGRYSDGSKKTILSSSPSSFTRPATQTGSSSSTTAISASSTAFSSSAAPPVTAPAKLSNHAGVQSPDEPEDSETDERRTARETVAEDLRAWQEKYASAADEGAAEMERRVEEIATRMIRRDARTTGRGLVEDLEQAVVTELRQLRQEVQGIVAGLAATSEAVDETEASDEAATEDAEGAETAVKAPKVREVSPEAEKEAEEAILASIRRAGVAIKQRAQAVRAWRETFGKELEDTVNRAAENHFTILASIRDLALQRIGMKWAWMEGVTYRDWAKYHQLKSRFDEWESEFEKLIVDHPAIALAQATAQAVEDEGMRTAQVAAQELARLKQVATWKVTALDASDDFASESMQAAAEAAVAAKAKETEETAEVEDVSAEAPLESAESASTEEIAEAAKTVETAETAETTETAETAETIPPSGPIDSADIVDLTSETDVSATTSSADATETEASASVEAVAEDAEPAVSETPETGDDTAEAEAESTAAPDETTDSTAPESTPSDTHDEL